MVAWKHIFAIALGAQLLVFCGTDAKKKAEDRSSAATQNVTTDTDTSKAAGCLTDCNVDHTDAGRVYFVTTVNPQLQKTCAGCHAEPRIKTDTRGPLTIFSFDKMAPFVKKAMWRESDMFAKLNNDAHGGSYFSAERDVIPLFFKWREVQWAFTDKGETGSGTGPNGSSFTLLDVTGAGSISGYAKNATDPSAAVTVSLFLDGDNTTGTLLGTASNNLAAKLFRFAIPDTKRDGCQHKLSAYATIGGTVKQLDASPMTYKAYKTIATTEYNDAKAAMDSACGTSGCHGNGTTDSRNRDGLFNLLMDPNPGKGTTAEKSILYLKASGGTTHTGGNRCGSGSMPCQKIVTWFNKEVAQCPP